MFAKVPVKGTYSPMIFHTIPITTMPQQRLRGERFRKVIALSHHLVSDAPPIQPARLIHLCFFSIINRFHFPIPPLPRRKVNNQERKNDARFVVARYSMKR